MLPSVAGHTLTVRRDSTVLLIGGYSPENGFNNLLLEFSPVSGNWTIAPHTGTPPTGAKALRLKNTIQLIGFCVVPLICQCHNLVRLWKKKKDHQNKLLSSNKQYICLVI